MNANFFRIERKQATSVLRLGTDGSKSLTIRSDVTRGQVAAALGDLPSGSHNRFRLACERVRAAGLTPRSVCGQSPQLCSTFRKPNLSNR